ncbi:hypothetical protein L6164_009789 [Bauhinia variegata]|uniref:Uncharacterized protein n=1 Tax=Bauhinia variegata TaxID=167791 RepID=A0ACB9PM77_BAUVA|nr:hypothetical protein L6164_009789 [Bauhinia variegata]
MNILCSFSGCFSPAEQLNHDEPEGENAEAFRVFSSNELKSATRGFHHSEKVGEGGFGSVYKGRLRDGTMVAVKVLSIELESMRGEKEFIAELTTLSHVRHQNLLRLLGCCVEGTRRYLVFEYMENNSVLTTFLSTEPNRTKFSWETRRNVTIGVARGLVYLHEEVKPRIVHRDIKAGNILLDANLTPKVSDFGLAKLLRDENSYISTRVAGTLGYLAPEYNSSRLVTRKSDVYSFGVLLLEIVSGRVVVDAYQDTERFLVEKAWTAYEADNLLPMVDPALNMNFDSEEAIRFLKVGLLCVQETAKLRPTMPEVVEMLSTRMNMDDARISKPGFVPDLREVMNRQEQTNLSPESSPSYAATSSLWSSANIGR